MNDQSYYLEKDPTSSDIEITDEPLMINCAGYVYLEKAFTMSGIRNDFYMQIMDVGVLYDGAKERSFLPGRFIIRSPHTPYRYRSDERAPTIGYYWVHFSGSEAMRLLSDIGIETDRIYDIEERYVTKIKETFSAMFRELMLKRSGYKEMILSLLISIAVRLGRGIAPTLPETPRKRLEESVSYIHTHYTEKISVSLLASRAHLSVSRFRELFAAAFGESPSGYITSLRINRAKEILTTTDLTVTETAELCGYSDVLYFSRIFGKKVGVAPTLYRRNNVL